MKTIATVFLLGASLTGSQVIAQNIGIGITTPQVPLHIKSTGFSEALRLESINPYMSFWDNTAGFRATISATASNLELTTASLTNLPITLSPGGNPRVTFLANGNTGIGITTPAQRLHVVNTSEADKSAIFGSANQLTTTADFQNAGVSGFGEGTTLLGGFGYGFGVKGIGSPNSYGAVGLYGGIATSVPTVALGGNFYALYADAGSVSANHYAGIFLNGNVGVGSNTPVYKLDVNGDVNLTGALRTNGAPGTAGQVLQSNGAAPPTWTNSSFSNNIRFSVTLITTANTASGNANCTARYNLNPGAITIGSNSISINHTGLYHFDIHMVPYSATPGSTPYFGLYFFTNSTSYELARPHIFPSQGNGTYVENDLYSLDIYLNSGDVIGLTFSLTGGGPSYDVEGWMTGNLVAD